MVLPLIARAVASKIAKEAAKNSAKQATKEVAETAAEKTAQQAAKETAKFPGQRLTGTRAAKDTKEPMDYTPEMSGRMRFRRQNEYEFPEDSTPRMSDDYKKGGKVKKYAEGGVTEGENKNIDDDTRMRARAAIMRRLAGEEDEAPPVKRSAPKAVSKPVVADKEEAKPSASGRARENVAPSGRGAAPGSFKKDSPSPTRYPTAAERGVQIRKSFEDAEAENVRKRNERAESGKSSFSDLMTGFKRRFGTQAMREEAGMKSGGKVKAYAKGGMIDGIAQRGKTKCKIC